MTRKIRVIVYGLGPIGMETARLVLTKTSLELVGAVDIDREIVGRDLGEVLKLDHRLNIAVTDNSRALFAAAKADIVIHTAGSRLKTIAPQIEEIVSAGLNVVSSAEELLFPTPDKTATWDKINRLALARGVTVVGTGVNPGFVMDAFPAYLTSVCQDVRCVRVERVVDAATRRYPLQKKIGAGMSPEVFQAKMDEKAMGHVGLTESTYMIASACGFVLNEVQESVEPVLATAPVKTAFFELKAGDIAGIKNVALGLADGKTLVTLELRMYIGAPSPRDEVFIEGNPSLHVRVEGGVAGDQATSAILVNSIPPVVNARPGLLTVRDITPTGLIR